MPSRREIIYISDDSSPEHQARSRFTIIRSRRNRRRRQRHRERQNIPLPINTGDGGCTICLDTYHEDDIIVTLTCHFHHHFHRHCIEVCNICVLHLIFEDVDALHLQHWMQTGASCPLCRQTIEIPLRMGVFGGLIE